MTNEQILQVFEGIQQLKEQQVKLNVKTSFNIANINNQILPVVRLIDGERRKLFEQYGYTNEDGSITVPKDKIDSLNAAVDELMQIESLQLQSKIKLDDFGDLEVPYEIIENLTPVIE